ncbi:TetR/AcrR family transcriptional regulator [Saccharopolyspora mangrovi]|uniref:TetR family transcriptional regulator C-terminal domain-containing protein n=1 Tax=Saccharopolyspora mangrovi TaxID=3082379 RepID=A0ABU6ADX9_9PSEU|nr:TetR family transcriptional regulator C-terminal domain-containing protein [Saccharopolyspora sp. S2-29]MEB3369677.1 TetR family transcriptional regulator C-terminal domain-containing protein [Saccharopolyspora sp. S2-29]
MPVRIDPDERRRHVTDAALRLIVAEGVAGVTFRKVAAEARLNIGSVRHYFADHETLVVAAVTAAGDRMGGRLSRLSAPERCGGDAARDHLLSVLDELVPLDEERRAEAVILVEVIAASRTNPAFAPVVSRMAADLHAVLVEALSTIGTARPETEAVRLAGLISGLSLNAVTPHGDVAPDAIRAVLRAHVATLGR